MPDLSTDSSPTPRRPRPAVGIGLALLTCLTLLHLACSSGGTMQSVKPGWSEKGIASWYGGKFHGRATASGEIYDMYLMTAAHKRLPLGTVVDVENLDNGKRVRVKVNDRGPFIRGRIIDLSYSAAEEIAMLGPGTAPVRIEVVKPGEAEAFVRGSGGKDSRWVVQAGAFRDGGEATALSLEIAQEFPAVRVREDEDWFRVQLGPWKKRKKADKMARKLEKAGYEALVRAVPKG